MLFDLLSLLGAFYVFYTVLQYVYSILVSRRPPSPRSLTRRKREMEIENKQLGYVASNSSSASSDEDQSSSTRKRRGKAKSTSPGREDRAKRPSYKQYLRDKRSRSRESCGVRDEGQPRVSPTEDVKAGAQSQVHWKVHKMPVETGPVSPSSPTWQEKASAYWAKGANPAQSSKQIFESAFDAAMVPSHLATPMTSRKNFCPPAYALASDKALMRRSWLNCSSHQLRGSYDSHSKSDGGGPVAVQEQAPLSLLSQSVHDALRNTPPSSSSSTPRNLPNSKPYSHSRHFERQASASAILLERDRDSRLRNFGGRGRSSEESSPLDSIPVRDSAIPERDRVPVQLVSRGSLSISENSAFRPIQPAESAPPAQSATMHSLARATGADEEPIYVSVNQVTQHPGRNMPPLPSRTRSEEGNTPAVTVLPVTIDTHMSCPVQADPSPQMQSHPSPETKDGDKACSKTTAQSTFSIKGQVQQRTELKQSVEAVKVVEQEDEDKKPETKPVTMAPFVAKTTPDESNLERWKARKKSMQQARGETLEEVVNFLGTKINRSLLENSKINIQERPSRAASKSRSSKTFQSACVQTETSVSVPLPSVDSRNSNSSKSMFEDVSPSSVSPLEIQTGDSSQLQSVSQTENCAREDVENQPQVTDEDEGSHHEMLATPPGGPRPQPTFIHEPRSQIMGLRSTSPRKSPSRSPLSQSESNRTWFVNPGKLNSPYGDSRPAGGQPWKQRPPQLQSRSPRTSHNILGQPDYYEKAILTAPPRIGDPHYHSPPLTYLAHSPGNMPSISSSNPRISLTPAQQQILQRRTTFGDMMHKSTPVVAPQKMQSLRPAPEFVDSPQIGTLGESISPILNRTNVSSKAKLFETMAQHQEDEKKKLYSSAVQAMQIQPIQQQIQQPMQQQIQPLQPMQNYYQPQAEPEGPRLSVSPRTGINRAQTYQLADFKSKPNGDHRPTPSHPPASSRSPRSGGRLQVMDDYERAVFTAPPRIQSVHIPGHRPINMSHMSPKRSADISQMSPQRPMDMIHMTPQRTPDMRQLSPQRMADMAPQMSPHRTADISQMSPHRTVDISQMSPQRAPEVQHMSIQRPTEMRHMSPQRPMEMRHMSPQRPVEMRHMSPERPADVVRISPPRTATVNENVLTVLGDPVALASPPMLTENKAIAGPATTNSVSPTFVLAPVPRAVQSPAPIRTHSQIPPQAGGIPLASLNDNVVYVKENVSIPTTEQSFVPYKEPTPVVRKEMTPPQKEDTVLHEPQLYRETSKVILDLTPKPLTAAPAPQVHEERSIFSRVKEMVRPSKSASKSQTQPPPPTQAQPVVLEPLDLKFTSSPMEGLPTPDSPTPDTEDLPEIPKKNVVDGEELDQCRLSVGQKTKLFEKKIKDQRKKKRRTSSRYQTQPVTLEEMAAVVGAMRVSAKGGTPPVPSSSTKTVISTPSPAIIRPSTWRSAAEVQKPAGVIAPSVHKTYVPEGYQKVIGTVKARKVVHLHTEGQPEDTRASSVESERAEQSLPAAFHRSNTVPLPLPGVVELQDMLDEDALPNNSPSIADRLAALKRSGESDWKHRVVDEGENVKENNAVRPELKQGLGEKSLLLERKTLLKDAQAQWHARVESKDQQALTISGKLEKAGLLVGLPHQQSKPVVVSYNNNAAPPAILDEGFSSFYKKPTEFGGRNASVDSSAFDELTAKADNEQKLVITRTVRPPRRKSDNKNPLKPSVKEVKSPWKPVPVRISDTPRRPVNPAYDPLLKPGDRSSQLASEAVQALSALEDISAIKLRSAAEPPIHSTENNPYAPLMLIQVKGRKHVYLRLVEPKYCSLNSSDCFILASCNSQTVFLYTGQFANVLEKARAKETAHYIVEYHDLGCKTAKTVVEMCSSFEQDYIPTVSEVNFLESLKEPEPKHPIPVCVDPDEDILFESEYQKTTRVYNLCTLEGDFSLKVIPELTATGLKRSILQQNEVFAFDFGVEVYVWTGRTVPISTRKSALNLAKCDIFNKYSRPSWAIFGHVKDKMETCLFREKFVDWLECSSQMVKSALISPRSPIIMNQFKFVTKTQALHFKEQSSVSMEAMDLAEDLINRVRPIPDQIIEDQSLGRGRRAKHHLDELLGMHAINTQTVRMWNIKGVGDVPSPVEDMSFAQLQDTQCYIVKWTYRVSALETKSLKGGDSKYNERETGRLRAAYFYWQGKDTTPSEQGNCALSVRDLDKGRHPHIRVPEGKETPAFLNLFQGKLVIHSQLPDCGTWRVFLLRGGPHVEECCLQEVNPDPNISLRPQGSFLIIDPTRHHVICWHGTENNATARLNQVAQRILHENPPEFDLINPVLHTSNTPVMNEYLMEYTPPIEKIWDRIMTPRMYRFECTGGYNFGGKEIESLCYDPEYVTPWGVTQEQLYDPSHSQPYLVLVDVGCRIWLWQGWTPCSSDSGTECDLEDEAAAQKLRMARLFAVRCAAHYAHVRKLPCTLVYSGCEPLAFKCIFPVWKVGVDQLEAARVNESRGQGEDVVQLADKLTVTELSVHVLTNRPLPDGVDSSCLEQYLSKHDFYNLFKMSKDEFYQIAMWKQIRMKQEAGLY